MDPRAHADLAGISEDVVRAVVGALAELGYAAPPTPPVGHVVPGAAADAMLAGAARALDDPAPALAVAQRLPIGSLGILDYGMCASTTLRAALTLLRAGLGVATQRATLTIRDAGADTIVALRRVAGGPDSRHWTELTLALVAMRMRQTLGPGWSFSRVAFRHAAPARPAAYAAVFAGPVAHTADDDALVFPTELLARPLCTAAEPLVEPVLRRLDELVPEMAHVDPLVDRARRTLAAMLDERRIDLATLAARLGASPRSLQRALAARATSHSRLLDQLRRRRAEALLAEGVAIAEVAERLAFSEPSAFFRVYRRWTGTTPRRRAARPDRCGSQPR